MSFEADKTIRITAVTGTRAEYGLLRPVLDKLRANAATALNLVVTGSHLSRDFGHTLEEIEADGFTPGALIDILGQEGGQEGRALTARRTALALSQFTAYFAALSPAPHAVLLLGDRYEIFAAGQAAALLNIPLAHISGGDVTYGADDDWFRHCLSKMAKLHFPSCEAYRQRLIRMGEQPGMVHNVGGLGDENVRSLALMPRAELEASLGIGLPGPYALVTFHPETQSTLPPSRQGQALLSAMDAHPQLFYLLTKANADAGGALLNQMLAQYCQNHKNAVLFSSLGALRYLSAMRHAALVLGNSSSGLAEAPSLGVPCVNMGNRQKGRVRCENIIDCPLEGAAAAEAMAKALAPGFRQRAARVKSPFNGGDTSGKIMAILLEAVEKGRLLPPKEFYDLPQAKP